MCSRFARLRHRELGSKMRHSQRKVIREEWERKIKEHKSFPQCKKKYKVFLALGGGEDG